jgi:hypothetical protein
MKEKEIMFRKMSPLSYILPLGLLVPALAQAQTPAAEEPAAPPAEAPAEAPPEATPEAPAEEAPAESAPVEEPAPAPAPVAAEPEPAPVAAEPEPAPPAPVDEAPAPSLSPLKIGTDVWSRFEYRENYVEAGVSRARFQEGDQTVFRTRLTIETAPLKLTEKTTGLVYFAPQASGNWGTQGVGGVGEANLGIYEGYFKIAGPVLEAKVGRFALNYGDAGVLGNLDWHQAGRSFDGAHFRVKAGKAKVDLFLTQQAEGYPQTREINDFMEGDAYLWGAYAELGAAITEGLALDLYGLGKSAAAKREIDPATGAEISHTDGATFMTFGARAKQKISIFDYRVEGGVQVGKAPVPTSEAIDKFAYQINGEVGVAPVEQFHIALGGAVASGDDPETLDKDESYDELYPTTHKWLGLMDVIGVRSNILSANLTADAKITKSTMFQIAGHIFQRMEENGLGRTPDATSDYAGTEVNAQLTQKIGEPAHVRGLYGVFLPNGDHYASDEAIYYTEIQAGLKF